MKNATPLILLDSNDKNINNYISFRNVKFNYLPEKQILNGLNLDIPFNKKVAIVGGSGSGKSTLARLLYRFYDPQEGQILINNQDIKFVDLNSLRKSIAIVPQVINMIIKYKKFRIKFYFMIQLNIIYNMEILIQILIKLNMLH